MFIYSSWINTEQGFDLSDSNDKNGETLIKSNMRSLFIHRVLMERDISISPDTARRYMDIFLVKLNTALVQIRRLVLVEDVVDSLKVCPFIYNNSQLHSCPAKNYCIEYPSIELDIYGGQVQIIF